MSIGVQAINDLGKMGFCAWVEDQEICLRYEGYGKPDPAQVRPLLVLVKEHKPEVIGYLSKKPEATSHGECDCGSPAWDKDADGKGKCWCCLAIPGLFGTH